MLPRRAGAPAGRHPIGEHAPSGDPGPGGRPPSGAGRRPRQGRGVPGDPGRAAGRHGPRSPTALAAALAAMIADGDPWRDLHPLFDLPDHPTGTPVSDVARFPAAVTSVG